MKKIMYALCALLAVWVLVSYCEVVTQNLSTNPTYWEYNAFVLLCDLCA